MVDQNSKSDVKNAKDKVYFVTDFSTIHRYLCVVQIEFECGVCTGVFH